MDNVTYEKDLEVIIQSDMQFNMNNAEKVKKANSFLGLIKKSFTCIEEDMFKCIYTALIRLHLGVCHLCMLTSQVG